MNPNIERLRTYPFPRLRALLAETIPPADRKIISMSIGEPRHAPPEFIIGALRDHAGELGSYPPPNGLPELREAMAEALIRRYGLAEDAIDPGHQILPVNGTREGLFSLVQAVMDGTDDATVVMPNPFYQIYEGATLLSGSRIHFMNTTTETDYKPDLAAVPESVWKRTQLLFLCSPGNPTGSVVTAADWQLAFELAERFDFIIAADECYADLYTEESAPPPGALEVAAQTGRDDFNRLVVLHSLSKRSSVPGLRSGLIAGDADIMAPLLSYRTYHGCAMPDFVQHTSIPAWRDPDHVAANRKRYQAKFAAAERILSPVMDVHIPPGAFYLWLAVPGGGDERFARELYGAEGLITLPGRYLSRETDEGNPGVGHLRVSLVPEETVCEEALERLARFIAHYTD